MASTNWNNIDKETIDAEECYCAFLDILGYKDKAERFFDGKFNLEGRFNRALANAKSTMHFSAIFADASNIQIIFFSDSIILFLPKSDNTGNQLFSLIQFCAILSSHLSYEDLFVRGGISFGLHKEGQNDSGATFLASIALQKAYLLEKDFAKTPRILIDKELATQLEANEHLAIAKESNDYFVHFSPYIINNEGKNTKEVLLEMQDIDNARKNSLSDSVVKKYTWILDYYYWTLSLIPDINMDEFVDFAPMPANHRFELI